MTLQEAINDKNRPLNVSPRDWMQQAQQMEELSEETVVYPEEAEETISEGNAFGTIDIGVDYVIQGVQTVLKGLQIANKIDLNIQERNSIKSIEENIKGGVLPYALDVVEELSKIIGDTQ
jgi:hypothetical protein